jgi:hypothetical protein
LVFKFLAIIRVPKFESGEMEVFSSTQGLMECQRWVAQVCFHFDI